MEIPEDWNGWRFAGRFLVSPDGERITPERLRGLLWRDGMELRLAGFASRQKAEKGQQRSAVASALHGARSAVLIHLRGGMP